MSDTTKPLNVFADGPWLFQDAGTSHTGAELDEAAFVEYRPLLEVQAAEIKRLRTALRWYARKPEGGTARAALRNWPQPIEGEK